MGPSLPNEVYRDILKKFGMDKAKTIKTLMCTNDHLDIDMGGTSVD
jgi:hypothetical protein